MFMSNIFRTTRRITPTTQAGHLRLMAATDHSNETTTPMKSKQRDNKSSKTIDRSKIPTLDEGQLEEVFISGWGPGGQKVNKAVNCCQLRHKPTGLIVKVHQTRSLEQNRKIARELMVQRLDNLYNGEDSLVNQKRRLALQRISVRESQAEKRRAMKEQFKKTMTKPEYEPPTT